MNNNLLQHFNHSSKVAGKNRLSCNLNPDINMTKSLSEMTHVNYNIHDYYVL